MDQPVKNNIRICIENEKTLYTPFSPEDEFEERVKGYIRSKMVGKEDVSDITMTVYSQEPMDEERFLTAVSNWIRDERKVFRAEEKTTLRMLAGLLVFGSIMIIISLFLQNKFEVLKYSLLPIVGSLALSRAASILVIDIPTIRAKRWMLNVMEKKSVISFEYGKDKNSSSDKLQTAKDLPRNA